MTAIEWLRTAATKTEVDVWTTEEGVTIEATRKFFRGNLPYRMKKELIATAMVNSDTECESFGFGTTYATRDICEYMHVTHKAMTASTA